MKKLLLLLFLIPNFSFAEQVNSFNQTNQADQATETGGLVDKYLIIDNHSPTDWWSLNSSAINEEWLDDKSLNLYNIKKGWENCNSEIDINAPSTSKKSEIISLNRNIEFISLRKYKEKVEIDIEEQKGNYYGLLVKLKIFKNYKINSAPVYLNIDKYLDKTTLPFVGIDISETTCSLINKYELNLTQSTSIGYAGWITDDVKKDTKEYLDGIEIKTHKFYKTVSFYVNFESQWKKVGTEGVSRDGYINEFRQGFQIWKFLPFAVQGEKTKVKVICDSCINKDSKEYLIDINLAKKQYDLEVIEKEKKAKKKLIERQKKLIDDQKREKNKLIDDQKNKKIIIKLQKEIVRMVREREGLPRIHDSDFKVDDTLYSLCIKEWGYAAASKEVRDRGYHEFMIECGAGQGYESGFAVRPISYNRVEFIERLKNKLSSLKKEKERKIQAKKTEKERKIQAKKLKKDRRIDRINKLKDECESIGFKKGTTKFKNCVLELM